jgi:hypothetical protein
VKQAVGAYWDTAESEARRAAVIPYGLARTSPAYRAALALLGQGDAEGAREQLSVLLADDTARENPYLVAYAHLDSARIAHNMGDSIGALRHIRTIDRECEAWMAHRADVDYLRVLCTYDLLQREEALAAAKRFLEAYPKAPMSMRRSVARIILDAEAAVAGSLVDVRDHMSAAGAHLAAGAERRQTALALQNKVEEMLTELIGDGPREDDKGDGPQPKPKPKPEQSPPPSGGSQEEEDDGHETNQRQLQRLTKKPDTAQQQQSSQSQQQQQSSQSQQKQESQSQAGQAMPGSSPGGEGSRPGEKKAGLASGTGQAGTPASDSQFVGGSPVTADGSGKDVARDAGERWGDMPPREREKVLGLVGSSFPESYRDVIEQYYRGLTEGRRPEGGRSVTGDH